MIKLPTNAAGNSLPFPCCVRGGWTKSLGVLAFDIYTASWEQVFGQSSLCRGDGHALLRMPDVKICPDFGDELQRYYITLALDRPCVQDIPHKLGSAPWAQYVRVAVWLEVRRLTLEVKHG